MEILQIIIIVLIVGFQCGVFYRNYLIIKDFKNVFPRKTDSISLDIDKETNYVSGIKSKHKNKTFGVIIDSVNEYLSNNKGSVSDFHIIKDVVDRNCDAIEEDINVQIPMPLYLGLVGTMTGILIGISFFVLGEGLNGLLNPSPDGAISNGIIELLKGVAMAMITSIVGILLTTIGSYLAKDSKKTEEEAKNIFLSWIQAQLLPKLSIDTSDTLKKLAQNLNSFNNTFSSNTKELRETLGAINESTVNQAQLVESINKLKIDKLVTANLAVYDKLRGASDQIGVFAEYLHETQGYLENVRLLNENLDKNENRTKTIEEVGVFFKKELQDIDQRKAAISESVGKVDEYLKKTFESFKESAEEQINTLKISAIKNHDSFNKAIEEQEESLQKKLKETSELVEELKNLTAVKTSISHLEDATRQQNQKIDNLVGAIQRLAEIKTDGKVKTIIPRWAKITGITGGVLLSTTCLLIIIPILTKWISNIINYLL